MLRYIKAVFGVYDHKWLSRDQFAEKFDHLITSKFYIKAINDFHIGSEFQDNPDAEEIVEQIISDPDDMWLF